MSCKYCDLKFGESKEFDRYEINHFGDEQIHAVSIEHSIHWVIRYGVVGTGYASSKGVRIYHCPMCGREL